jgi:hypothetical protein
MCANPEKPKKKAYLALIIGLVLVLVAIKHLYVPGVQVLSLNSGAENNTTLILHKDRIIRFKLFSPTRQTLNCKGLAHLKNNIESLLGLGIGTDHDNFCNSWT